jgi:hypothetical protein
MKCNVNPVDSSIRAGVGLLLLASPLLEISTYPYNYLGLVLITTATVGYCPLYSLISAVLPSSPARLGKGSASHG